MQLYSTHRFPPPCPSCFHYMPCWLFQTRVQPIVRLLTVNGYQLNARSEAAIFTSPESLFTEYMLLMTTCYSLTQGKITHNRYRRLYSKWNNGPPGLIIYEIVCGDLRLKQLSVNSQLSVLMVRVTDEWQVIFQFLILFTGFCSIW